MNRRDRFIRARARERGGANRARVYSRDDRQYTGAPFDEGKYSVERASDDGVGGGGAASPEFGDSREASPLGMPRQIIPPVPLPILRCCPARFTRTCLCLGTTGWYSDPASCTSEPRRLSFEPNVRGDGREFNSLRVVSLSEKHWARASLIGDSSRSLLVQESSFREIALSVT